MSGGSLLPARETGQTPEPQPGGPASHILIIEDSTSYQKILKTYFEREGFHVSTASSGEEGLEMLERERPHLIVLDFMLPGLKGNEVCEKIKLHSEFRSIPVVMLTSRGQRQDITTGLNAGADDYVVKSGDIDLLLLRVRNLLKGSPTDTRTSARGALSSKILTIDDDPFFSRYLGQLLLSEGYQVHSADCGEKGIEEVNKNRYDCIIVDFIMPGIQGDEVCRRLKAKEGFRDIPVVLLTTRGDRSDMIAGLNAGADDYILKTVDKDVLKSRIKALLRRKYYQDEHRKILEELKAKELEAARAKAARDVAEEKALLSDQLHEKNVELESINQKLQETQQGMIQAEKMASLGLLVAGIAHEINNPLAYVLNNLATIERDLTDLTGLVELYRDTLPELEMAAPDVAARIRESQAEQEFSTIRDEVHSFIADSKEGLERIKLIVVNLRNFSRIDEGEIQVVDVTEGIRSTLKIIGHLLTPDIQLVEQYGTIPEIECYPGLLNQVFLNILVNALHAIEGPGRITIRTFVHQERVCIQIADSGCGMSETVRAKIFDPFYTTKPVGSGTGLGLSTSYGIISKHGGSILVDSSPGKGSVFTVVLPQELPHET